MQASSASPSWGYRPHLDGLRAVAVYLVLLFHSGSSRMSGGFIGVDIFFVLSGYLVTNLLMGDLDGPGRRVRFGRFYSRRIRRLLPAAAVNLVVTAVVFAAIASPVEVEEARKAIVAAALYFANWHFIGVSTDYFAAEVAPSPVLHYWSLAIEEQFYFVWPLLLTGIVALARRAGKHRRNVVRAVVVLAGSASAVWALWLAGSEPTRAYMGTDTRAYQLFAGAALALTPGLVRRVRSSWIARVAPVCSVALLGALAFLSTSALELNSVQRGVATTIVVCALLVALETSSRGPVQRLLSWPPVLYLGRISYGTYLWHWLVVVYLTHETDLGPIAIAAATAVVATGIASLSYQIFEQPVLTAPTLDRRKGPVVAVGLTISLLIGLVAAPQILVASDAASGSPSLDDSTLVGGEPSMSPKNAYLDRFTYEGCHPETFPCTVVDGGGLTAMVIGDSHAAVLLPALAEVAERHDVRLESGLLQYCPWLRGIALARVGPDCWEHQDRLYDQRLPQIDPDIVFLAHRPIDDLPNPVLARDREEGHLTDDARRDEMVDRRMTELVTRLRSEGRTVVMFEPAPSSPAGFDPRECLSEGGPVEECRFVAGPTTSQEKVMRRLASLDLGVVSVDLDTLTCPYLPICDPIVSGIIVRLDDNHLTDSYARTLAGPLGDYLDSEGVFQRN